MQNTTLEDFFFNSDCGNSSFQRITSVCSLFLYLPYPPPAPSSCLLSGPGFPIQLTRPCDMLAVSPMVSFQIQWSFFNSFFASGLPLFFMLPFCGLFSVNLLMKMPAKDINHLKTRKGNGKEKGLYSHCFLSSCCLLSLTGKISGIEHSFTLKFFQSGDRYGFYFLSLP